jgi:Predicted periplasmic ligand-binding sensor domain
MAQQFDSHEYRIHRIGVLDGLANQIITGVCETPDGLLWFSTQDGLYHFDGFRVSRIVNQKHPNRAAEHILDIEPLSSSAGNYLVICNGAQSRLFDFATHQEVPYSTIGLPDEILSRCVSIEKKTASEYVLICGENLYLLSQKNGGAFSLSEPFGKLPKVKNPKVILDPSDNKAVWITCTGQEIMRVEDGHYTRMPLPQMPDNPPSVPGLLSLVRTSQGLFGWDNARNLYQFNQLRTRFEPVNKKSLSFYDLFPALVQFDRLVNQRNTLHCTKQLSCGQLALGTSLGICIAKKMNRPFHLPVATLGNEIRGITTGKNGEWYAGSYFNLIVGRFNSDKTFVSNQAAAVWAYLPLRDDLWMLGCENAHGIIAWNPKTNTPITFPHAAKPKRRSLSSVLSLCKDHNGFIWVGTYSGIYWADPKSPFDFQPLDVKELYPLDTTLFVRSLMLDKVDSSLWIGTARGVFKLKYKSNPEQFSIETLHKEMTVSDFYQDILGHIWIASKGAGFGRYRHSDHHIDWFTTEQGLSNDFTCRIEGSNRDSVLWISTHNGLSRFDVFSNVFHHYRESDGMPGNEFNSAASAQAADGTLLFGGPSGLVYFHPDSLSPGKFRYSTIVSYAHLFPRKDSTVTIFINNGQLHLPPYLNIFEICVGVNDFISDRKNEFPFSFIGGF